MNHHQDERVARDAHVFRIGDAVLLRPQLDYHDQWAKSPISVAVSEQQARVEQSDYVVAIEIDVYPVTRVRELQYRRAGWDE
jgi:hypothetical protein